MESENHPHGANATILAVSDAEEECSSLPNFEDNFGWMPQWDDFSSANFNIIRDYIQVSLDDEDNHDDGKSVFSEVYSANSGLSPSHEAFPRLSSLDSGFVGDDVDMILFSQPLPSENLLLPTINTQITPLGPNGLPYSPSGAFGAMSIQENKNLMAGNVGMDALQTDFSPLEFFPAISDYDYSEPTNLPGDSITGENVSSNSCQQNNGETGALLAQCLQNATSASLRPLLGPVPPVTISPCSRPPSPQVLQTKGHTSPLILPSQHSRKRHHSESAMEKISISHKRNSLNLDYTQLSSFPFPSALFPCSGSIRTIRPASSRVQKSKVQCPHCPDPSIYKPGQKLQLDELPSELLIEIFTFACSSPPIKRTLTCEHMKSGNSEFGLQRRSTTGGILSRHETSFKASEQASGEILHSPQRKCTLPRHLRLAQAKTILAIQLTCRKFNEILTSYQNIDNKLWKAATIGCWGHLPGTLAEVQGWSKTSQTCWRNVFGVFMRSDNGMFKRRNAGGVGGVESFGGKNGFSAAVLWDEEKRLRAEENNRDGNGIATGKGKQKAKDMEEVPPNPAQRKLLLVCVQPGPDAFTVQPLPGDANGYEIGLTLENREHVFVHLDDFGNFSKKKNTLPFWLRRSKKGRFPPDCFQIVGDRFSVAKVVSDSESEFDMDFESQAYGVMRTTIVWNLQCVTEYANDKRASVARCAHRDGYFLFNMFASREGFIEGLDKPQEDHRLFCVLAVGQEGCNAADVPHPDYAGGSSRRRGRTGISLSAKRKGKMKASDSDPWNPSSPNTIYKWQRVFVHPQANNYPVSQGLHYSICNFKLNSSHAVVLIRWNIHSRVSYHEFVDRSFQVLDIATGVTVKVLQFPNFHWDFRHHDMTVEYNVMRYYKMRRMYNARNAGNRATRVHDDEFTLDDKGRIVSGSHDYCNWVWDINAEYDEEAQSKRVFNPVRNDAGKDDPFLVLDDFYWNEEKDGSEGPGAWNTNNERAGWWVKTPNQVLCFWHNFTVSKNGRWFAAARAGRMFVWDLEDITKVQGFSCALGTYSTQVKGCTEKAKTLSTPQPTVEARYMGKILNPKLEKRLKSWFVWNGVIPEQGLWLMYDDGKVVYFNRDDLLDVCGLAQEGKRWGVSRAEFGEVDTESEESGNEGSENDDDDDDNESLPEYFGETDCDDDCGGSMVVIDGSAVGEGRSKQVLQPLQPVTRRKRRRTMNSGHSRSSSFVGIEGMEEIVTAFDSGEKFVFDNELPDAETWEQIDDEGWLKRAKGAGEGPAPA
ncbi:hypothetical protein BDZ91DRAFT_800232 [Kalaharituber pfeilii]|nr:hypothetical protein BDZ91DRAFT_800232 [Kalaharituber pfeilii]